MDDRWFFDNFAAFSTVLLLLQYTIELQWLEHCKLVYHGYFELVAGSTGKHPLATDLGCACKLHTQSSKHPSN